MASSITSHDRELAKAFYLWLPGNSGSAGGVVQFQYPPEIISDGRSGDWVEIPTRAKEPIAVLKVPSPRIIIVKATWIVDADSGWPASKIATQLLVLRGYMMINWDEDDALVAKIRMGQAGGKKEQSCRIKDVSIKYSRTQVGKGNDFMPLVSSAVIDIRLWSKGNTPNTQLPNSKTLDPRIANDWY